MNGFYVELILNLDVIAIWRAGVQYRLKLQ